MDVAVFSAQKYDITYLTAAAKATQVNFVFFEAPLNEQSAALATQFDTVCCFVNDDLSKETLHHLNQLGVKHVCLRCAGFNNVDLDAAKQLQITVSRVPSYSPEAVAEHTVALLLSLNRKIHKAYNRVKEDNFSLNGLMGFNVHNKVVGIVGTGNIGVCVAKILNGFGAKVICFDPKESHELKALGAEYVTLHTLFCSSDIISLHCPLTPATKHLINQETLATMKQGVTIINTSRGGLIDTKAIINGLKTHRIANLALDVYEMESELFFQDLSAEIIQDDVFQRLLTFPNVIVTGHQGFFTHEAMNEIAHTVVNNIIDYNQQTMSDSNQVV